MYDFWISMPLSSGMTGCGGLGDEVGALGGKSSTARRSGGTKMALKGKVRTMLKRSARGALWELWELLGNRRPAPKPSQAKIEWRKAHKNNAEVAIVS